MVVVVVAGTNGVGGCYQRCNSLTTSFFHHSYHFFITPSIIHLHQLFPALILITLLIKIFPYIPMNLPSPYSTLSFYIPLLTSLPLLIPLFLSFLFHHPPLLSSHTTVFSTSSHIHFISSSRHTHYKQPIPGLPTTTAATTQITTGLHL